MLIIPVIDLSQGIVVHAICGKRKLYQPITSEISEDCKPKSILSAFFRLYPFKIIYIADLDAIQGNGNNASVINQFASKYKNCQFWVDAGIEQIIAKKSDYISKNIKLVLGSENNFSLDDYNNLMKNNSNILLSLDFCENGLINNPYLLNNPTIWPKKVIVMMLHRVGSTNGIDFKQLKNIIKLNNNSEIYVAGGIQNFSDINNLNSMNVRGCLVATSLHKNKITKDELDLHFNS